MAEFRSSGLKVLEMVAPVISWEKSAVGVLVLQGREAKWWPMLCPKLAWQSCISMAITASCMRAKQ